MIKKSDLLKRFESLLPLVANWVEEQEKHILSNGIPLSTDQQIDAWQIGVSDIARVRLMKVDRIPLPRNPMLKAAAKMTGLVSPHTAGISFRYGIYIRSDQWDRRNLVVHELTHTMQYERFGSIKLFLQQYLHECLTQGYPEGELEQEAIRMEREMCSN